MNIPDSVTSIGNGAFYDCAALESATLPEGLTSIGEGTFLYCASLTNVTLPNSMTTIGGSAFGECVSLESVTLPEGLTSIGESAFMNCSSLSDAAIPSSVTTIGENAFCGCGALTSVTIPDGVTSIEFAVFFGCENLNSVTIPDSVTSIEGWAFLGCHSLRSITIPASVTIIGEGAFEGCPLTIRGHANSAAQRYAEENSIRFVDLDAAPVTSGPCGENVTWSFEGDTLTISGSGPMEDKINDVVPWLDLQEQIKNVDIQAGVTTIGAYAFSECEHLQSVAIPNGVTSIGAGAFMYCTSLTRVAIPEGVTVIGPNAFAGCTSLTDVTIPDSVTSVGQDAFTGTPWLGKIGFLVVNGALIAYGGPGGSATIPNGVTSIGQYAFMNCTTLTSVTIPEGVTGIGAQAFWNCSSLESVTVPASVARIGLYAFAHCSRLASITILNPKCVIPSETADEDGALGVPGTTTVYGHEGSTAQAYAAAHKYAFQTLGDAPTPTDTPDPTPEPTNTPVPTATPVPQLAAPTVTIAQVSDGIKVTWNAIEGSPRYMVYYKENNGGWKQIGTTAEMTYTRKAANLKSGATYQFTVRCCANDKKTTLSGYKASNSITYTTQLAAPTVTISKAADGIKVSWNKITGAPRYMVYYKENGGSWKKIGTTTSTTYTRASKYLKNGKTYQFTVRCCANDKKTLLGPYKASNSLKYTK